jgi:ribonucleoside-diphosphate reductase alpha chain
MEINVVKRNGKKEVIDLEKFHRVTRFACEDLTGVSVSELEIKTHIQFYNNISTTDIQETLIKAAADMISEEAPNYQYVAGRLINYGLRKEVYGQFDPPSLKEHIQNCVSKGTYDEIFLDPELGYTDEEYKYLESKIDHTRDFNLTYAAMEQMRGKYLVKNRVTNDIYETPQMAMMCIAMCLFHNYGVNRMFYAGDLYNALSNFDISLPTPIMAGVRTSQRQFSSCVLIETDDSLDSINATASSIVKYVSQKAGIGIGAGRIRSLGSAIRDGDTSHTGSIPFYKYFQSAVKSCSQGGVRGGAATLYYPLWHLEVEDLLVLKNNKGTEDNRVRHLDYGVQFNQVMYERLVKGQNITLFCPNEVPELYETFFTDVDAFRTLYEQAERKTSIRKKTVAARDLFAAFMQERKDTGRIYLMNVDNANDHGAFIKEKAPIRMSNLCCEINLPTKPLNDLNDPNGEISLCTLAAVNWGNIKAPEDFFKPCTILVMALDALLDYQNYPVIAAQLGTEARRPLGIGIINFAYWLAKNNTNYQDPNLELIHEYAEAWSYCLIKASADIAQDKGACSKSNETKYSLGQLPIDTYKTTVDELVKPVYKLDWESLRNQLRKYGIRNSTLMALMPAETSAQISNSTNGIEPPRSLVSIKQSKDGVLKQVVPNIRNLKNKYDLLWDQTSPIGYLKIMAVLQKFIDQGISVNTSYNPLHFKDEKIPLSDMLQHMLMFYKYGGKQLYYFQTYDGAGEIVSSNQEAEAEEEPQACDWRNPEDCDACKL